MTLSTFQENLVEFFISSNIFLQSIESPVTKGIFQSLGVAEEDIPTAEVLKRMILCYAKKIKEQSLQVFKNKSVSLIIDGTTSWNQSIYEFALYYPGIVRHFGLIEIDPANASNLKQVINSICTTLSASRISVIGLTTDNGSNLVAAFKQIETEAINNKTAFPLIRFACAAHTGQLLIADLHKSNQTMIDVSNIVSTMLVWLRKKKIRKRIKKSNLNSPPSIAPTRWNSIYICCEYLIQNYDSIVSIIHFFDQTKWKSPIILDLEMKSKIYALQKALGPLSNFTNSVQKNFVSAGDVYYHLNNLQIEMSKITDQYHFAQDIFFKYFFQI